MRGIVLAALVAAAGCSEVSRLEAGPTDRFYFPTGVGATAAGHLVVASSNFDLRYDDETGGSVIAVNPAVEPATVVGAANVRSLGGQLAVADPAAGCGAIRDPGAGAIALLPVRGASLLYQLRVAADGAVSCTDCAHSVGSSAHADPYTVAVGCGPGFARAFVGSLVSATGQAVFTQVDLARDPSDAGAVQHAFLGDTGQVRGFAYDAGRQRLYLTHTVNDATPTMSWIDLAGGCELARCRSGATILGAVPRGLELRAIALASEVAAAGRPVRRRAYLTARVHDPVLTATAGGRVGDFDGVLLVADLVETLGGQVDLEVVRQIDLGYGAGEVVVLPPRAGRGDVVAALATDSGRLVVYDDETGAVASVGADLARPDLAGDPTGAPLLGHVPVSLAASPVLEGDVARVYVGSFQDGWVTPVRVDVPLDGPATACLVSADGSCAADPWLARHIGPGVSP